jgi:hypothetical protein
MEYGNLISRALEYAKDGLVGKWGRWVLLVILSLVQTFTLFLIPLFSGYMVRVLAGKTPAPDVDGWGRLFVDGWKLNIITLIYMIPVILIALAFGGLALIAAIAAEGTTDPAAIAPAVISAFAGLVIAAIVGIVIWIVLAFAQVRFAHTGSFGEAFNLGAIFAHIGRVGWGTWIVSLIILVIFGIVYGLVVGAIALIPIVGFIINLFLGVAFGIFSSRFIVLVYESASAPR